MQTKFTSPIKGNNKGSSARITTYLEKENYKDLSQDKEYFFSTERDKCNKYEVMSQIDMNGEKQGLEKKDDRFFSLVISPSPQELAHIGEDSQKLKDYTRQVMENYAANFCDSKGENRGMSSKDLVWYAKIEHERKYGFDSPEVKAGLVKSDDLKKGDQRHIHIIVSRCEARENRQVLGKENKREHTTELCPNVTSQKIFDRDAFFRANENSFDKKFGYERDIKESYDYCNAVKKGSLKEYEQALLKQNIIEQSPEKKMEQTEEKRNEQQQQMGMNI